MQDDNFADPSGLTLSEIANFIEMAWPKVNYAARPYLNAMKALNNVDQAYGSNSGRAIVTYFLSNASSWQGDAARQVKAELRRRIR